MRHHKRKFPLVQLTFHPPVICDYTTTPTDNYFTAYNNETVACNRPLNWFQVVLYLLSINTSTELLRLQAMTAQPHVVHRSHIVPQGPISRVIELLPVCS
jgi:hypothetical protein